MKRIMVFAMLCMALIFTSSGIFPASANGVTSRGNLPWQINPLVQTTNIKSVSVGYDNYTRAPLVAYYDTITQKFRQAVYVGAGLGNCGVNGAWDCVDRLADTNMGEYNDVANYRSTDNTYFKTGYVYFNGAENAIYYLAAWRDAGGGGISNSKVLDFDNYFGGAIGSQPSLAFDPDGVPHIAFIVDTGAEDYLIYAHYMGTVGNSCEISGGSGYWQCDEILVGANIADDPSIAITAGGTPQIAYYDPINTALGYAYPDPGNFFDNCGPNDDWRCIVIDELLNNGRFPSLAIGDETYIAYYNVSTGALMAARYVTNNGNCGNDWNGFSFVNRWQCDQIDQVGSGMTVMGLSLVMDGAEPIIAYRDGDDGFQYTVKVAQTAWRMGMDYGNCGPENPFSTWYCQTIDQGPFGLGGEIDMAINSSGALQVAYLEEDDDEQQNHLWYANQFFVSFLPVINK